MCLKKEESLHYVYTPQLDMSGTTISTAHLAVRPQAIVQVFEGTSNIDNRRRPHAGDFHYGGDMGQHLRLRW